MRSAHRTALLAALAVFAAPALAAGGDAPHVYQQRTADGSVLLTDRPIDGAQTERIWQIWREDPVAARERSEQVRREAQIVSERIERRIELQRRADQAELDRLAAARRDADIARETALDTGVLLWPGVAHRRAVHPRLRRSSSEVFPQVQPGMRPRFPRSW